MEHGQDFLAWKQEEQNKAVAMLNEVLVVGSKRPEDLGQEEWAMWEILVIQFKADAHFKETLSHRSFIKNVYLRFGHLFPHVDPVKVDHHDDSKLNSFIEIIGYTDRWVWQKESSWWQKGLEHHYKTNGHHPEFHVGKNGERLNMPLSDLQESILDMVACHWERNLGGNANASQIDLFQINERFLLRYNDHDRKMVESFLEAAIKDPFSPGAACSSGVSKPSTNGL